MAVLKANLNGYRVIKKLELDGVFKMKGGEIKESTYKRADGETQYTLPLTTSDGFTVNFTFGLNYGETYFADDGSERTDNSLSKIVNLFEAVSGKKQETDNFNIDTNMFKNKELIVLRTPKEYNGNEYANYRFFNLKEEDVANKLWEKEQDKQSVKLNDNLVDDELPSYNDLLLDSAKEETPVETPIEETKEQETPVEEAVETPIKETKKKATKKKVVKKEEPVEEQQQEQEEQEEQDDLDSLMSELGI